MTQPAGRFMQAEIAEAPGVFARAVQQDHRSALAGSGFADGRAIYTIARGSSDAVANILSYDWMAALGRPMTSLPPSVFSLGDGVDLAGTSALVVSQSGASDDLVRSARGIRARGGKVAAITNVAGSPVEAVAHATIPVDAGEEHAVPATKTVIGSLGAGLALLGALSEAHRDRCAQAARAFEQLDGAALPGVEALVADILRFQSIYVVGRGAGYGTAHEVALKIKETCARHAEAYSASEVLHGPLQLVKSPLLVILLDTGEPATQASLATAEARFRADGSTVHRLRLPGDPSKAATLPPPAVAAMLLYLIYPVILSAALALGFDPDAPETLKKVTATL